MINLLNPGLFFVRLELLEIGNVMKNKIRVTIMDDHQGIVDGYLYRLGQIAEIEVVSTLAYGEELEPALKRALELKAFLFGIPYKRYDQRRD